MNIMLLIGQIMFGGYFIYNAYNHFKHHKGLAGYAKMKGVPMPETAVIVTGVMMFLGGLSVLTGFFIVSGMMLLVLFLIPTTIMMHAFWKIEDPQMRQNELISFTKNFALVGALLMLIPLVAIII